MKTIILSILILFSFTACKAQNERFNHVSYDKIKINNLFDFDTNPITVKSHIGNPVSIQSEYYEMDEVNATAYYYNGLKIDFVNNRISYFKITNNTYSLFIDGLEIKVGDPISVINNRFSKSYKERGSEATSIGIGNTDSWILIIISNDIITGIEKRSS